MTQECPDHIKLFQQEIARLQHDRLMRQKTSTYAPVSAKAYANLPYFDRPVEESKKTMRDAVNSIKEVFGPDNYFRFNYVGAVVNNVIGFIAEYTYNLLKASNLQGPGTSRVMSDIITNATYLFNRYNREGVRHVEAIKYLRYSWFSQDSMGRHITNIKEAYLDYIINSKYAYRDSNANDLMAWCYAIIALSRCSYRHLESMRDYYNSRISDHRLDMVIDPWTKQDEYDVCNSIAKFIKLCKFPSFDTVDSKRISAACDVFVNQCKLVPFNKYYQQQKRLAKLEGKTIRIA